MEHFTEEAIPVRVKIWWHVYPVEGQCWGFASIDGVITDVPYEYNHWKHKTLQQIKSGSALIARQIVKAAEQCL